MVVIKAVCCWCAYGPISTWEDKRDQQQAHTCVEIWFITVPALHISGGKKNYSINDPRSIAYLYGQKWNLAPISHHIQNQFQVD